MNRKNNSQKSKKYVSNSDSSQEDDDDDHVRNTVAFQVTSKKDVNDSVTIDVTDFVTTNVTTPKIRNSNFDTVATCDLESDLDSSDGEEPSTEDIQEAYQIMYDNWVKVCKINKALKERVAELTKEKEVLKRATINYEFLASDRERKIQQVSSELINT